MKNAFGFYLRLMVCIAMFMPVASCGFDDDDEVEATYPMELLGSWTGVDAVVSATTDGGEPVETTTDLSGSRIAINPNGTFVTYENAVGADKWQEQERGFWAYKDAMLYVTSRRGDDTAYSVDVLTNYSLVLTSTQTDTDDEGVKTVVRTTAKYTRTL